jgi:hypothetical protein
MSVKGGSGQGPVLARIYIQSVPVQVCAFQRRLLKHVHLVVLGLFDFRRSHLTQSHAADVCLDSFREIYPGGYEECKFWEECKQ